MGNVITMKRATLSMEQANVLFNRECMAICGKNCITVNRAKCLLDDSAVEYALHPSKSGSWWNLFGLGTFGTGVKYLTFQGFIEAVGWFNVEQEYNSEVLFNDSSAREEHGK